MKTKNTNKPARKPGELIFSILVVLASVYLLFSAYGISKFEALSAPGAIPMAATAVMVVTSLMVLYRSAISAPNRDRRFLREVLPARIAIVMGLILAYAIALKPLGFLPTSALFLILLIKLLSRKSWGYCSGVGLLSLLGIYLIFRIVFTVLMPAGIVPEGEILAFVRNIFSGGN
jgi:putative tricarboxylic transport membrane protein